MGKLRLIFILLFLFAFGKSHAQISEDEIKAVYLVKIIDNFQWESNSEPLKIGILSTDRKFYFTLKNYVKEKTIVGRPITVSHITDKEKANNFDVIYYGIDKPVLAAAQKTIRKNVLVVTNELKGNSNSMVNFYMTYDHKLRFKVNRELLKQAGFEPSTLLLILGGSDNDILSLFEAKDSTLLKERNKSIKLEEEIKLKTEEIQKLMTMSENILNELNIQKSALQTKNIEVLDMDQRLKNEKYNLDLIFQKVNEANEKLVNKEDLLGKLIEKSARQENQFQVQNKSIREQQNKIKTQKSILLEQTSLINLKERDLRMAFIFSFALLIISVFALISYIGKRKSNKELEEKNKKIIVAIEQLQKTQAKLVQSEKMASLGMVTAGMAHEINNPMTFILTGVSILKAEIKSYLEVLKNILNIKESTPDNLEKLQLIIKDQELIESRDSIEQTIDDILLGAHRVTEIIKSLQNFSRLDENDVKTIDLQKNIESTLVILGSHARKHNVIINTNFDENNSYIECFPASLNQVLVNLISNAIDAVSEKPNPEINISTKVIDNTCHIEVIDNGKGISSKNIDKIFDPFFTTKEVGKGTGLGLSITYNIIKKHNGNIKVSSEINKGTSFRIEIPIIYTNQTDEQ